ncbi:hypothetical protein [Microviridae sp.]|nr:hypothetical protein [Microviridae sp.]UOF78490.1 hypothetical protein [Microviridae sp.]
MIFFKRSFQSNTKHLQKRKGGQPLAPPFTTARPGSQPTLDSPCRSVESLT